MLICAAMTFLGACAHPRYPTSCKADWFYHDGPIGYWNAYTLPNTRDGFMTGLSLGGIPPIVSVITKPVGAVVGGVIGLVPDVLNMTVGAISVVAINPATCSDSAADAAKEEEGEE